MTEIERICFDKDGPGHCGVALSRRNEQPYIHVFEIRENDGGLLNACLADGLKTIRDQFCPGTSLGDIDWKYTNGIYHSDIKLEEQGGILTRMHLSSNELGRVNSKISLQHYQDALKSPDGFEDKMSSGHGFVRGQKNTIFPIRLGGEDRDKVIYFASNNYDGMTPVLVDAAKFLHAWRQQEERFLKPASPRANKTIGLLRSLFSSASENTSDDEGRRHDLALFQSTKEKSRKEIWNNTSPQHPIEAAFINFNANQPEDCIAFSNGRHRTFNMANLAASYVLIDVGGDVDAFRKKFEWAPSAPSAQARRITQPLAQS
ncbi:MAG: hypothetical protein JWO78_1112 [Micavibrio sp.]|nr:hypothetical protein [Micavibrio sp.]